MSTWWMGPYLIQRRLGHNVYELEIRETETREAHADQLKRYHGDDILQEGVPLFYDHTYPPTKPPMEVEWIREHRQAPHGLEFLVHWKGAPVASDSWEPPTSFLTLFSSVWVEYCERHQLFSDLQGLPMQPGIYPRVASWEDSIL